MSLGMGEKQIRSMLEDKISRNKGVLLGFNPDDIKVLSEAVAFVIAENNTKIMQDLKDAGYNI